MAGRSVAIVGAGWAGIAAASECVRRGHRVTLFEMGARAGGRARDVHTSAGTLDNGQHICIGAYVETLRLLERLGISERDAFVRLPLTLVDPSGRGLRLRRGAAAPAFVRAVLGRRGWPVGDRLALLAAAAGWWRHQFRCDADWTVARLAAALPRSVREGLIDPLCVAALNTPAAQASASVFLRVLRDALASGPGSADLLLPRVGLGSLLPEPALEALRREGAVVRLGTRVVDVGADGDRWRVDSSRFDRVILAASTRESARLASPHDSGWARSAAALRQEPIVTVYAQARGARLAEPMLLLHSNGRSPAQFVFDRGQLGGPAGLLAFVVSGASAWVERGTDALEQAVLGQAGESLGGSLPEPLRVVQTIVEKRATFACTPDSVRPPMRIVPGLLAAGDYVSGPYPATLEGAVRSGIAAAVALTDP